MKSVGRGGPTRAGHLPFTPRAEKVLELSLRDTEELGHDAAGTAHILLGLIGDAEGTAARVHAGCGVSLDAVHQRAERADGALSAAPADLAATIPQPGCGAGAD